MNKNLFLNHVTNRRNFTEKLPFYKNNHKLHVSITKKRKKRTKIFIPDTYKKCVEILLKTFLP